MVAGRDHYTLSAVTRPRHNAQRLLPASDHSGWEQAGWQRCIPGRANARRLVGERDAGLKYLQLPPDSGGGSAVAISNDGRQVAGTLGGGFRAPPSQAAMWVDGVLQTLPTGQTWSEVGSVFELISPRNPHPMTSDGSIIVGAAGPSSTGMQATKWVNGVEQQLSTGNLQPTSSVATFVTDNGIVFGTATTSDGHIHLVRWDADGNPEVLEPPPPFGVVGLTSID